MQQNKRIGFGMCFCENIRYNFAVRFRLTVILLILFVQKQK